MFWREERGSVLVIIMIATVSLLVLGGAFLTNSLTERRIAWNQERHTRLYYIAEAGLEAGIAVLQEDFSCSAPLEGEIGGGSFVVEFETLSANRRLVRSTGSLEEASMTLEVVMEQIRRPAHEAYEKALLVSNNERFENAAVYGDVHVNEEMQVKGENNLIIGKFSYSDKPPNIHQQAKIQINENIYTSSLQFDESFKTDFIPIPKINSEEFEDMADAVYAGGQIIFNEPPPYEKILVKGNLTIDPSNDFNYEGMIVVTGNATINGPINVDQDNNNFLLLAEGNLTINKEEPLGGKWLLYTTNNIMFKKSSDNSNESFVIKGAIIAEHNPPGQGLESFTLYHDPSVFYNYADYLPEYGEEYDTVIGEWRKP